MLENHIYYPYGMPEDDRPTICTCDACRSGILGRKGSYFGEAFYEFPNGDNVHVNCLNEWANNYSVDGSEDEALCWLSIRVPYQQRLHFQKRLLS